MQVILLERIENLGQMGDTVSVKPGYARNFLLPQKKALRATKENQSLFESRRAQLETENLEKRSEAEDVAKRLTGVSVVLIRQAGDNGQLYGSVNARDLSQALADEGISVHRNQISLDKAIKLLGLHPVSVRLHPEVTVNITANVARSEAEAESQAATGHMVSADEQREAEEEVIEAVIEAVEEAEQAEAEAEAEAEATAEDAAEDIKAAAEDSPEDSSEKA